MVNQNINKPTSRAAMGILMALSFAHFSNDVFQSIVPSIFPMLEESLSLNLAEIGIIALVYQVFASIFQPIVGIVFDKRQTLLFTYWDDVYARWACYTRLLNELYCSLGFCSLSGRWIIHYSS